MVFFCKCLAFLDSSMHEASVLESPWSPKTKPIWFLLHRAEFPLRVSHPPYPTALPGPAAYISWVLVPGESTRGCSLISSLIESLWAALWAIKVGVSKGRQNLKTQAKNILLKSPAPTCSSLLSSVLTVPKLKILPFPALSWGCRPL